ncbi:hypothetical protein TW95_gp1573 [Pandoravirus inopinatum]|uniref:Uncharacterized protein n=1 Tax=Pandoravirus inopinatum TaxID=1605721 RepID=A0A0B5JET5_9VIRU|nr:hypothetical protein TW95_gp1573 [Pandoravirus inopinatum]AJF98307.1 hypothetical protein [Pandoravirus inopinatum]
MSVAGVAGHLFIETVLHRRMSVHVVEHAPGGVTGARRLLPVSVARHVAVRRAIGLKPAVDDRVVASAASVERALWDDSRAMRCAVTMAIQRARRSSVSPKTASGGHDEHGDRDEGAASRR